jgi:hypothetical protein
LLHIDHHLINYMRITLILNPVLCGLLLFTVCGKKAVPANAGVASGRPGIETALKSLQNTADATLICNEENKAADIIGKQRVIDRFYKQDEATLLAAPGGNRTNNTVTGITDMDHRPGAVRHSGGYEKALMNRTKRQYGFQAAGEAPMGLCFTIPLSMAGKWCLKIFSFGAE